MIETVARAELAVNENIVIRKNRISNLNHRQPTGKRVCIVTGTHGDELGGRLSRASLRKSCKRTVLF